MKRHTTNLAKLMNLLWMVSMGLYLGLSVGLVLSVITTFKGSEAIRAQPGVAPYREERFAEYHHDAVAGYIGQDLFMTGGKVVMALLGIALFARVFHWLAMAIQHRPVIGSKRLSRIRLTLFTGCVLLMIVSAQITLSMNERWPRLYDMTANERELDIRRAAFDQFHGLSETGVGCAWLLGLFSVLISPWCLRPSEAYIESLDGQTQDDEKEGG